MEAVTLAGELRLISLGSSEIQGVIDCYGHLACHALHELQFGVGDALRNKAAEAHGAKAVLGGSERKNRKGTYIMLAVAVEKFGEAGLFMGVADDKGLLRLPDPAGGGALDRRLTASGFFAWDGSGENVGAHYVASGIVKDEGPEIEVDDRAQAVR